MTVEISSEIKEKMEKAEYTNSASCPKCKWDAPAGEDDDPNCIHITDPVYDGAHAEDCHNPLKWEEYWDCPQCHTIFYYEDGNC
jgi:hypothetical protein